LKLAPDSFIAPEKSFRYLLVPMAESDKSAFLAQAGYDLSCASQLIEDIRRQILPHDATPLQQTEHGQYYEIRALLTGPNGRTLRICSIWMRERLSGITKFITLFPDKTRS
jgi:hypothetical protein